MNENTNRVAGAQKIESGEYYGLTYGGAEKDWMASGAFTYRKIGNFWQIWFTDFTVPVGERTMKGVGDAKTLKEAQHVAERMVHALPNNMQRRREAALRGAMPV